MGVECLFPLKEWRKLKALETTLILFFLSLSHPPAPLLSFLLIVSTLKWGLLLARLPVLQGRPRGSNNKGSMGVCVCVCVCWRESTSPWQAFTSKRRAKVCIELNPASCGLSGIRWHCPVREELLWSRTCSQESVTIKRERISTLLSDSLVHHCWCFYKSLTIRLSHTHRHTTDSADARALMFCIRVHEIERKKEGEHKTRNNEKLLDCLSSPSLLFSVSLPLSLSNG